jgi:hypothetical protein
VDEKWIVPHFEKMSYDNSELLKNFVHAYQATGDHLYAAVAKDIIRWVDEWLSDRDHGGFYASQDADYSLDDDGDYFTWSRDEARSALTEDEFSVASEYYDIGEIGEMHHNHGKNVLWVAKGIGEVASSLNKTDEEVVSLLGSARKKMYSARLQRPTPYVDKTMYVNWNAMMASAYLLAGRVLELPEVLRFGLKSLDRILAETWHADSKRLDHVLQYSGTPQKRSLAGHLDDYAFTVISCLDAYECTGDMSYFRFAHAMGDALITRFCDPHEGGFFDVDSTTDPNALIGALVAKRKPLQDSPTPAGNSAAAIAMLRLHHYTGEAKYRDITRKTLECFAGVVDHFGIYAGTYGLALRMYLEPATQIAIIGTESATHEMQRVAAGHFRINVSTLRLGGGQAVAANLPPALAETLPNLPGVQQTAAIAVLCSNFTCLPSITSAAALEEALREAK